MVDASWWRLVRGEDANKRIFNEAAAGRLVGKKKQVFEY